MLLITYLTIFIYMRIRINRLHLNILYMYYVYLEAHAYKQNIKQFLSKQVVQQGFPT